MGVASVVIYPSIFVLGPTDQISSSILLTFGTQVLQLGAVHVTVLLVFHRLCSSPGICCCSSAAGSHEGLWISAIILSRGDTPFLEV